MTFSLSQVSGSLAQGEVPATDELYDIIVPTPDEPFWSLLIYPLLALAMTVALVWLIVYVLRSRKPVQSAENSFVRAGRRLHRLELNHEEMEPNQFSLAVSDTLKDFLSELFSDPVRYETTQEYLARMRRVGTRLPEAAQQELSEFLTTSE